MGRGPSGVFYGGGSPSIRRGGLLQGCTPRRFRARVGGVFPFSCTALVVLLVSSALALLLLRKVGDVALRTKTVAGHLFPPKEDTVSGGKAESFARASRILRCSYLTCPASSTLWGAPSKSKGTQNGKTQQRPAVLRSDYESGGSAGGRWPPPSLFRYCTTKDHFDIPFPDWSFWGWPEINIEPWDEEFKSIKLGSQARPWALKHDVAYWKGNPDVDSPIRMELLNCNDSKVWGAQILRQNWVEEVRSGFQESKLSNQCNHRYKIYAEGYAWSVSLKYIISCGSLALLIDPQYEDFFSRGLIPGENYWPISRTNLCKSIKSTVDWGNAHPTEAEAIGKRGQAFLEDLSMERVYEYMYHLIVEYSKLQDFKPTLPPSAQVVCQESVLCFADPKQRQLLRKSTVIPSPSPPCTLPSPGDV